MRPALTDEELDGICKRYALQPDTIHGWDDIDGKNGSKGEIAALLLEIYRLKFAIANPLGLPSCRPDVLVTADGVERCPRCAWPLKKRLEDGCIPGTCRYATAPFNMKTG